jgi:hypothetical protein
MRSISCRLCIVLFVFFIVSMRLGIAPAPSIAESYKSSGDNSSQDKKTIASVLELNKDAVVRIQLVTKSCFVPKDFPEIPDRMVTWYLNGTVIDSHGLTVVSRKTLSPFANGEKLYSDLVSTFFQPSPDDGSKHESTIVELKIVQSENKEIPLEVVREFPDFDLALLSPVTPISNASFVNLHSNVRPEIVDQVISLRRIRNGSGLFTAVDIGIVSSIVTTPHLGYQIHDTPPGCPVFNSKGQCFGITLLTSDNEDLNYAALTFRPDWLRPLVVPADEILKLKKRMVNN